MRRLLAIALFAALVAGMGFSQVTWGGLFQYGAFTDFDFGKKGVEQAAYGKLIFTDQLDKFNTIVFRFRWKDLNFQEGESLVSGGATKVTDGITGNAFVPVATPDWDVDRFYLSTDVTGALGVTGPVTFKMGFGFQDPNGGDLTGGISPFEVADLSGNDVGGNTQATIYPVITINKMVNIGAIIAPGIFSKKNLNLQGGGLASAEATNGYATYTQQGFEVFANGGVAPFMAEVGFGDIYRNNGGGAAFNGVPLQFVWVAANFKQTMGDIAFAAAANAQFNVNSKGAGFMLRNHYAAAEDASLANAGDVNYGYGVCASLVYKGMYTAKVGFVGIEGSPANRLEAQAIAMFNPIVGIDVGAVCNLDSAYTQQASDTAQGAGFLNDLDAALRINLGKGTFRIGYKYIDTYALYSVMSDDIGLVGDANGKKLPGMGAFIESSIAF